MIREPPLSVPFKPPWLLGDTLELDIGSAPNDNRIFVEA